MYYSATTGGFYDRAIHATIPEDAVAISDQDHGDLLDGQREGKEIVGDDNGYPVLAEQQQVATVPVVITPRQCRLMLLSAGLLDTVNGAIEAMQGDAGEAARITWDYATEVRRDDPLLGQITGALELTSEQVDQMFIAAAIL